MKLQKLIEEYKKQIALIHDNRREIKTRLEINRVEREKLNKVKRELVMYLAKEQDKGKTLYKVCMEHFKKIDGRFHILLSLYDSR